MPAENQTTVKKLMREEAPVRNTPQTPASAPHKSRRPPVATKPPLTRTKTTTNATPVGKKKKVRSRSPPATTGRVKFSTFVYNDLLLQMIYKIMFMLYAVAFSVASYFQYHYKQKR